MGWRAEKRAGLACAPGLVAVPDESLALRCESERLTKDQFELGLALQSAYAGSQAATASSDADLYRAEAGWRLAVAELKKQIALP